MIGSSNAVSPDPMDYFNFTIDREAIGHDPSYWYKLGLVKWESIQATPVFTVPASTDRFDTVFAYSNLVKAKFVGGGGVTTMMNFIIESPYLEELDFSELDLSKITTMQYLANGCEKLAVCNFGRQNTPLLKQTMYLLSRTALKEAKFSEWVAESLENISGTFTDCRSLEIADLSGWRTSNVTEMPTVFYNCPSLKYVNLSGWTTESVTTNVRMFRATSSIEAVVIDSPSLFQLTSTDTFLYSSVENGGTGFVYVPDNLVDEYKTATNWVLVADQIKPLSELPQEVKDVFHM